MTDLAVDERAKIEARARKEGAVNEQLRQHDVRITANHDAIGRLRASNAVHDTAIKVIGTEVAEMRTDIGEMNIRLDRLGRNFYVAAAAMCGLMLSVLGLVVTLLSHA